MDDREAGWSGLHRANQRTLKKLRDEIDAQRRKFYSGYDAGLAQMREEQIAEARASLAKWKDRVAGVDAVKLT